ncbi:CU044_2847 family protein [Kitasatospora sp. NPDC001660]
MRRVGPGGITVEFGIDLAVEAGVVITKSGANYHPKVTVMWNRNRPSSPGAQGAGLADG